MDGTYRASIQVEGWLDKGGKRNDISPIPFKIEFKFENRAFFVIDIIKENSEK
jgi:hypothetical protein